jgi:hypothetical protein
MQLIHACYNLQLSRLHRNFISQTYKNIRRNLDSIQDKSLSLRHFVEMSRNFVQNTENTRTSGSLINGFPIILTL